MRIGDIEPEMIRRGLTTYQATYRLLEASLAREESGSTKGRRSLGSIWVRLNSANCGGGGKRCCSRDKRIERARRGKGAVSTSLEGRLKGRVSAKETIAGKAPLES